MQWLEGKVELMEIHGFRDVELSGEQLRLLSTELADATIW